MKLLRQMQRTKQLTVLLICGLALSGCGNYLGDVTVEGRSGLARSEAGDVIIRVQPCGLPIDSVRVSGPYQHEDPPEANPAYLRLRDEAGRSEPFVIDPAAIESSWTVDVNEPIPSHRDAMLIVNSHIEGKNSQTSQVSGLIKQVRALKQGEVLVGSLSGNSRVVTEEEFLKC